MDIDGVLMALSGVTGRADVGRYLRPHPRPELRRRDHAVVGHTNGSRKFEPDGRPVVCIDFDGTLVDARGRIHPADVRILAHETSVAFVPTTGRPLHSVRRVFQRHGLFAGRPIPFPLVVDNGATVYAGGETPVLKRYFDPALQDTLMRVVLDSTGPSFLLHNPDEVRAIRITAALRQEIERFDLDVLPFYPGGTAELPPLCKVSVTAADPEVLNAFEDAIAGLPLERARSLPGLLDITPAGVHKALGLSILLNGARPEVLAVGDGENDLALFEAATLSFAPSDAPPAIRDRADRALDRRKSGLLAPILEEVSERRRANGSRPPEEKQT